MLELAVASAARLHLIPAVLLDDMDRLPYLRGHFLILEQTCLRLSKRMSATSGSSHLTSTLRRDSTTRRCWIDADRCHRGRLADQRAHSCNVAAPQYNSPPVTRATNVARTDEHSPVHRAVNLEAGFHLIRGNKQNTAQHQNTREVIASLVVCTQQT